MEAIRQTASEFSSVLNRSCCTRGHLQILVMWNSESTFYRLPASNTIEMLYSALHWKNDLLRYLSSGSSGKDVHYETATYKVQLGTFIAHHTWMGSHLICVQQSNKKYPHLKKTILGQKTTTRLWDFFYTLYLSEWFTPFSHISIIKKQIKDELRVKAATYCTAAMFNWNAHIKSFLLI